MIHRFSLHPKVAVRAVAGEIFLVSDDRAFHHAHVPVAVDTIAALRKAPQSEDELVQMVTARYDVDDATARSDMRSFLLTLVQRKVAVTTESPD